MAFKASPKVRKFEMAIWHPGIWKTEWEFCKRVNTEDLLLQSLEWPACKTGPSPTPRNLAFANIPYVD